MSWFTRKGHRVWGEGGYAAALTRHGWTPEDPDPEPAVEFTIQHQAHADLTDAERADVDQAVADETGPPSNPSWDT